MANEEKGQQLERRTGASERRTDSFLRDILDNLDQYAFGIITQHGYRELEAKLDQHNQKNRDALHRWVVRGLIAFGIMGLGVVLGLVGYGVILGKQGSLLDEFKNTRESFVLDSCTAQNRRHEKTVSKLVKAEKKEEARHKSLKAKMVIRNRAEISIGLIDSLAPVQDCKKLAAVSVGDAKPPPPDIKPPTPKLKVK